MVAKAPQLLDEVFSSSSLSGTRVQAAMAMNETATAILNQKPDSRPEMK